MCDSVLTQTCPLPPPGAAVVRGAVSAFALVGAAGAAAGLGELFGLKKSANVFFSGEAAGDAAAFAFRPFFSAGEADAIGDPAGAGVVNAPFLRAAFAAGSFKAWPVPAGEALATGEAASVAAAVFFRDFLAGEADASAAGDSLAAGDASAAAFLCERLDGEAEALGVGDCALTRHALTSPITNSRLKVFMRITHSVANSTFRRKAKNMALWTASRPQVIRGGRNSASLNRRLGNQCCARGV